MIQLVCASANPDKVVEIQRLLDGVVDLLPRPADVPDVVEDADTLLGNARLKAVALCAATGLPAVADPEGCSYADNRAKLLSELAGSADRRAAFKTVAIVVWPDGTELHVEGVCPGVITTAERGDIGFGYDQVFQPDEGDGGTFAEMGIDAKNVISHRGRAFRALLSGLAQR